MLTIRGFRDELLDHDVEHGACGKGEHVRENGHDEICVAPLSAPANTTPTAIPSGRLWMVTARASIAVFDRCERKPSGLSVPICRCGVSSSMSNRNPIPNKKPTAAGNTAHLPLLTSISIAGISNDHTEAATITPDAKPNSDFCNRTDISSRIKNTNAEPSIVPNSGINSPMMNVVVIIEYKDIWA